MSGVFSQEEEEAKTNRIEQKDIAVSEIPKHIIRYALAQNPFFYFDSLARYFPNVVSLSNFIESENYLGVLKITFNGSKSRFADISNFDYLLAVQGLLQAIETEIKSNLTEYEGSDYIDKYIHEAFKGQKNKGS